MSGELGIGWLDALGGILLLLQVTAMGWFAFRLWRSVAGRAALVFLIATVAFGLLEGVAMLARFGSSLFSYTSGTEGLWMILWSGNTAVGLVKAVALLLAGGLFAWLAAGAKKSRRA